MQIKFSAVQHVQAEALRLSIALTFVSLCKAIKILSLILI